MRGPIPEKRTLAGDVINHSTAALMEFKAMRRADQQKKDGEVGVIRNEPRLSSNSLPYLKDIVRGKNPSSIKQSGSVLFHT
jgi:hypothetical protein